MRPATPRQPFVGAVVVRKRDEKRSRPVNGIVKGLERWTAYVLWSNGETSTVPTNELVVVTTWGER